MPDTNGPAGADEDLLLASMAFFQPVLEPIFEDLEPSSLCEIGIDQGRFTHHLLDFCKKHGCRYIGIDPQIANCSLLDHASDKIHFISKKSLDALPALPPQDLYIIDGDHNHHTVLQEIRFIFQHEKNRPVLIFHDTAWPFARRDLYYAPDQIPKESRVSYCTRSGPWPGKSELSDDGFCANDQTIAIAESEGGPENGVLTAIEDAFVKNYIPNRYQLVTLPIIFGCSILYAENTISTLALDKIRILEKGADSLKPLLESMESNRMRLFLELLASWKKFDTLHETYGELMKQYEGLKGKYGDLHDHSDRLLEAYHDLARYKKDLEKQLTRRS